MDYWKNRDSFDLKFIGIKRKLLNCLVVKFFISMRLGEDFFILEELRKKRAVQLIKSAPLKVLDVGCGRGRDIAYLEAFDFYGVDIAGFPRDLALKKGYKAAESYDSNLSIPFTELFFDAAIIVNVNAHISNNAFIRLLSETKKKLKKDGIIIIIAELNNYGLSYDFMRKSSVRRFNKFVSCMDHTNLIMEDVFTSLLHEAHLQICSKTIVMGQFLPLAQYLGFFEIPIKLRCFRHFSLCIDVVLSILDNCLKYFLRDYKKGFQIGYVTYYD